VPLHAQELFLKFLSMMVHFKLPGGIWREALPLFAEKSTLISTLRSGVLSSMVAMQPLTDQLRLPVATIPWRQNRYSPVCVLNSTWFAGLLSSCRQPLKTLTANAQVAVLFAASVAIQVTDVVPTGKAEPDAGEQTVVTPGQLSVAVGAGKFTGVLVAGGH
jgi:hypothetical protein